MSVNQQNKGNMSWSIDIAGERKAVKKRIQDNPYLPESVKAYIAAIIHDQVPDRNTFTGIKVSGFGYHNAGDGSSLGSIGKLEVTAFEYIT